mmetsp:Transcript_2671/g.5929  ORF Transcript_2671/g.5929 Transcript_2671/m.5929 type:complete len:115 (-) Transcript_2671:3-347(-)
MEMQDAFKLLPRPRQAAPPDTIRGSAMLPGAIGEPDAPRQIDERITKVTNDKASSGGVGAASTTQDLASSTICDMTGGHSIQDSEDCIGTTATSHNESTQILPVQRGSAARIGI